MMETESLRVEVETKLYTAWLVRSVGTTLVMEGKNKLVDLDNNGS
jgi:hypothetical protein